MKERSNASAFTSRNQEEVEEVEEMCPVCKSTKYLNPKLTLLVSPCYHWLCETCIERLFRHGSSPCPLCGTTLRKGNFVVPLFGDLVVEKELRIRKIVSKAFYKRAEDFDTLREYNNYLEEFEDIVFNLVNDVDVQSTHSRLEAFKSDNRDTVEKNLARLANEQRQAQIEEDAVKSRKEKLKVEAQVELDREKDDILKVKKKFINDLANSNAPAAVILAEAQKTLKSSSSPSNTGSSNRNLRPVRACNSPSSLEQQLPKRSRRTLASTDSIAEFDALKNVVPLKTLLPLPDISTFPSDSALDLFADLWPPAPSSRPNWDISLQMRAAGFSVDLVMKHCLKAALSWGL